MPPSAAVATVAAVPPSAAATSVAAIEDADSDGWLDEDDGENYLLTDLTRLLTSHVRPKFRAVAEAFEIVEERYDKYLSAHELQVKKEPLGCQRENESGVGADSNPMPKGGVGKSTPDQMDEQGGTRCQPPSGARM
eukprot:1575719-Prymnesium_polylepis.1